MYGWPERRKYPLDTRRQVHAAIAHFARWRLTYPWPVRREIEERIRTAADRWGISLHVLWPHVRGRMFRARDLPIRRGPRV